MLQQIFIASLFSYGWCALFWDEMILNKVGDWLEERLPKYITTPLFDCPICNSFWVSTSMYWFVWKGNSPVEWLSCAIGSVGLNAIVVNIINKLEAISEAMKPTKEE